MQQGVFDYIAASFQEKATSWSFGTFGAGIDLSRQPGEPFFWGKTATSCKIITPAGGASWLNSGSLRAVAFETAIGRGISWGQGIALCVPESGCGIASRTRFTEIGPDGEALRAQDRQAILFDLGLATRQVDICARAADPRLIAELRAMRGSSLIESTNEAVSHSILAMPLDIVIRCEFGRAECFSGASVKWARRYVLPEWIRLRRSHAATTPIPRGWLPCAYIFPPHPLNRDQQGKETLDLARFNAFQAALLHYGDAAHIQIKADYFASLESGSTFSLPETSLSPRFARSAVKVAERQALAFATGP